MLETAKRFHAAGQFIEAEKLYRLLAEQPDMLSTVAPWLGLCLTQQRRFAEASVWLKRAAEQAPRDPVAWFQYALAAQHAGQLEPALRAYEHALQLNPCFADALNNYGNLLADLQRNEEALACLQQLTRVEPRYAAGWLNLGCLLTDVGRAREALAAFAVAEQYAPDVAELHYNYGRAWAACGDAAAAARHYEQAVALRPDYARAWNNLGVLLLQADEWSGACQAMQRAIACGTPSAEHYYNLGIALQGAGDLLAAAASFRRALECDSTHAAALNNLGTVEHALGQFTSAADCYRQACHLAPDNSAAHNNLAHALLLHGDWEQGWQEYEWRWRTEPLSAERHHFPQPMWNGEPLTGRTLLLVAEQGLGDTIQFIRYAQHLADARELLFLGQPALKSLLAGTPGIARYLVPGEPLPPFDFYVPLLSLPRILRTTLATVPCAIPYLTADPHLVNLWRERLSGVTRLRVGINWRGRPGKGPWRLRDVPLSLWAPLARLDHVQLVQLQQGPLTPDEQRVSREFGLMECDDTFDRAHGPFMDTAALMCSLDLVISSDTSVPHVAGALGVPTWLALPHVPDWRWLRDRSDTPWYPSLRLFRQPAPGDWPSVMANMEDALRSLQTK